MIDLAMIDRLVRALPESGHLALVGDADQLPSVDAGAVFRDLCAALGASRLTTNLRVASDPAAQSIVTSAMAVNAGACRSSRPGAGSTLITSRGWTSRCSLVRARRRASRALVARARRSRYASPCGCRVPTGREGDKIDEADEAELLSLFANYGSARLIGGHPCRAAFRLAPTPSINRS